MNTNRPFGIHVVGICMLFIANCSPAPAFAQVDDEMAVKVIIGEASNQGSRGMLAVAEVLRRRGSTRGFCALKRRDLDRFIDREGPRIKAQATSAWKQSEHTNITNGATHYENTRAFGVPYWAKDMDRVAVIGDHAFYKKRR